MGIYKVKYSEIKAIKIIIVSIEILFLISVILTVLMIFYGDIKTNSVVKIIFTIGGLIFIPLGFFTGLLSFFALIKEVIPDYLNYRRDKIFLQEAKVRKLSISPFEEEGFIKIEERLKQTVRIYVWNLMFFIMSILFMACYFYIFLKN